MTTNEKVFDILEQTNLNWRVQAVPLVSANPLEKAFNNLPTSSVGIFRCDDKSHLGTVGKIYNPLQNWELAETMVLASEGVGIDITRGGLFHNGQFVYLQCELKSEFIGTSDVKRYITALNSHNGTSKVGFGSSNTVVVCQNTFYKAYSEVAKFTHTAKLQDRVSAAIKDLRSAIMQDQKLMREFHVMSDTPLRDEVFADILKKCFNADLDAKQSEISTQKIKMLQNVRESIMTQLDLQGNTLWGLFNGVTRYTNHYTNPKNKDEYIMKGSGYRTNLKAYGIITDYLKEKQKV